MIFDNLNIVYPKDLDEAVRLQADEQTRGRLLAGGTDLMVQWASGAAIPERIISIFDLPELAAIQISKDVVEIGAGVTHAFLRDCKLIHAHLPALVAAAASVGAMQIQSRGTVGGNAANASPAGDTSPALLVTDGLVLLASANGLRTVPLTAFWTGYRKTAARPDEIIVSFILPKKGKAVEYFRKIGTRKAQAISKAVAAARILVQKGHIEYAAIAFGSMAATPIRLSAVEQFLAGKKLTPKLIDEAEALAQETVAPIADIRSTAEYRRWIVGRLIRDMLDQLPPKAKRTR